MANKQINQYNQIVDPEMSMFLLLDPGNGEYKKMTLQQLADLLGAVGQLAAPAGFNATAVGPEEIELSWSAVINASDYLVQRSTSSDFSTALTTVYTGSGTSFSNNGLTDETTYYFRVKATAEGFTDSPYSTGSATTLFDVDTITGQFVWQADDASTLTLDGSSVTEWREKLAGVANFVMPSSSPTLFATGGANNKPYISGSSLNITSPVTTTPVTYYLVLKTPSITPDVPFVHWRQTGGANGLRYTTDFGNKGSYIYTGVAPYYGTKNYSLNRTIWMLVIVKFTDNNTMQVKVNDQPAEAIYLDGSETDPYSLSFLNLSTYSGLQVAEVRMFNRINSAPEEQHLKDYFLAKYEFADPQPVKKIIVFGDSHTVGIQSGTPSGSPYMSRFMQNTSYNCISHPQNGTCAVNNNSGLDFKELYNQYNKEKWNDYWIHLQYGTNDCATASGAYGFSTWANWKAEYKAQIQSFIDAGFDPLKIILISPPNSTGAYVGGNIATCANAIAEIADELNVSFINWYQMTVDAGLDAGTVVGGDNIHVPNTFHDLVYTALIAITGT